MKEGCGGKCDVMIRKDRERRREKEKGVEREKREG